MITFGKGKYKVWLKQENIGDDRVFYLGGGERSHIGSVVICEPGKKTHIIRRIGHYDDIVLKPIAEKACKKFNNTIVVIGGVHINNGTKQEIDLLVNNCLKLAEGI